MMTVTTIEQRFDLIEDTLRSFRERIDTLERTLYGSVSNEAREALTAERLTNEAEQDRAGDY
jgi:predicted  nucleic acid-binding Zn-ribbon protein